MLTKYKKTIKRVFCVPAAIVGAGVFGVAVGGMAVLGGIGTVCYIAESIIETTVDTLFDITNLIYNLSTNNEIPVAAIEFGASQTPELDAIPIAESKALDKYDMSYILPVAFAIENFCSLRHCAVHPCSDSATSFTDVPDTNSFDYVYGV